jgi:nitroimidazol reductase NimA-like FMN-containing flavoprotein (pyridoxamine 5'-phosphate oxidase superfamily)
VSGSRDAIVMSDGECVAFLQTERTVICATNGTRGWPHLMPLWYIVRDGELWAWTFAKSQKVRNLERDPHATLQVEAGESYDQLRGVMIEADTTIHREPETVAALGVELMLRYAPPEALQDESVRAGIEAGVAHQAPKRVGLQFTAVRTASFDHRKLADGSASS